MLRTAKDLRDALEGVPDDMPVYIVSNGGYTMSPAEGFQVAPLPGPGIESRPDVFRIDDAS